MQDFDAQNPPFDRLTHQEAAEIKAALDVGYYAPGETIIAAGQPAEYLHIIIKGRVEEREGEETEAELGAKESFDARALVHGSAGASFVAAEETLCHLAPKDIVLDLIRRNAGFAAFFYQELSRKLTDYARRQETEGVEQVLRARVKEARLHPAPVIGPDATIREAGQTMAANDTNALIVRDGERVGVVTGANLSKAAVLKEMPLDTRVGDVCRFEVVSVDADDFIFEALIKMTRHNKRRLVVTSKGEYVGMLEDIDILGLVAGNSQLIPGRIDRAHSVEELEAPARDIQLQVERLERQGVKVEVIAEITSDLNRALFARLFDLIAPDAVREHGCLMVMGSEGRGEQTVRTDQDNGLLLDGPVEAADLERFRRDFAAALERFGFPPCPGNVMVSNPQWSQPIEAFLAQIRGWVMTPDEMSAMNLGIFFDAVAVAGRVELLTRAKKEMVALMRGETAYLSRFARAIDQFEGASAGMLTSFMATVGVGSDLIDIKKSGTFPIVHGIRTLAIDRGLAEASTAARIDALAQQSVLSEELAGELKSALSYFMEVRLRSQLRAMKAGHREEEAIVKLGELSTRDRDLLRDSLKVVKRFREIIRSRYHLALF
jgi:CBS domain-containing protein